jgi:hypothetical protein
MTKSAPRIRRIDENTPATGAEVHYEMRGQEIEMDAVATLTRETLR